MNSTPTPDAIEIVGHPAIQDPRPGDPNHTVTAAPVTIAAATVPRQVPAAEGADADLRTPAAPAADPAAARTTAAMLAGHPDHLDDPDAGKAADAASVENLLRCWVRESEVARPDGDILRIPLDASGTALLVPVRYWSATGWHRFGMPLLESAGPHSAPVDAVTVAALLSRESGGSEGAQLVARVADSVRRTADFLTDRRATPAPQAPTSSSPANSPSSSVTPPPHTQEPRRALRHRTPPLLTRVARLLPPPLVRRRPVRARHRLGLDRTGPRRPRGAAHHPSRGRSGTARPHRPAASPPLAGT